MLYAIIAALLCFALLILCMGAWVANIISHGANEIEEYSEDGQ